MKLNPITSADRSRFPSRRALIAVTNKGFGQVEHAVIDADTGARTVLPECEAWALHQKLNRQAAIGECLQHNED